MAETTNESVTPRPWPANSVPTDERLADWLASCTAAERIAFVRQSRRYRDTAERCFMEDHEYAVKSYKVAYEELRDRQDRAMELLGSFDPTSGTGRTQAFVSDLRNTLWATDD